MPATVPASHGAPYLAGPSFPRTPPADLIADLRDAAEDLAPDLEGIAAEETMEGEAAQMIEEMVEALTQIADGAPNGHVIARAVLDVQAPLKPISDPADTIRNLLKPRGG